MSEDYTEAEIRDLLAEVYTTEGVRIFLASRNTMLDLHRPADLMLTPEGRRRVYGLALFLAEGNFA